MFCVRSVINPNNCSKLNKFINISFENLRKVSISSSEGLVLARGEGERTGIFSLGINRPETKNALSKNMLEAFSETLESIKFDKNVRVLIIHSLVKNAFCSGADLKERALTVESEIGPFVSRVRQIFSDLRELPLPTIAAIDGPALGGGLEVALACDLCISSSTSKIGLVETKIGIIPGGGGTQMLPRLIGPARAKELIYTGRILDGYEALKMGLVNDVVDQNSDGNAAFLKSLELAAEIKDQGPTAVRLAKIAIDKGLDVDVHTGLATEQACYAQVIGTKGSVEGLKAFKEKRLPKFQGE